MTTPPRWNRAWTIAGGAVVLSITGYGTGQLLGNRSLQAAPPALATALPAAPAVEKPVLPAAAPEGDAESVVLSMRKRIMGRLRSLEHIRRVATEVRPILDRHIEMPEIQDDLRVLAKGSGMSLAEYKEYFKGKEEADLLLESGGDPNAHSVADAIGVAQFLAGTGRACGLKINLGASQVLSRQIRGVERQIEDLEKQAPTWARAVPPSLRGYVSASLESKGQDASLVPAAAAAQADASVWTRDQWIAYRRDQWKNLVMQRRQVDQRYSPDHAIRAQMKYLVKLTRRYGGVDWALQAYHGGEGGAARTMRLFAGGVGGSRSLLASRAGYTLGAPGRWLPYSELYRHVSPTGTPEAFSYLFGRSDDHRYYWWKVKMAERALDLYRKDPKEFEKQWKELQPGYSADKAYYPEPEPLQYRDNQALRAAYQSGELVALPGNAASLGIHTSGLATMAPESSALHKGLRPEAMGALLRLAHIYRSSGGASPLNVVSMVQSNGYRKLWKSRYPDPPLPPDIPRDPDFHSTGLVFDIQRPARDWDRKVLEYALGRLHDTLRISWRQQYEGSSRRYHVIVNPEHKAEMVEYHRKATGQQVAQKAKHGA